MSLNSVLPKDEADKIAVAYTPRKFPAAISKTALEFHRMHSEASSHESKDFRIDRILAEQTGIGDLERMSLEEKVELEALRRVKDIQEDAYRAAYEIGALKKDELEPLPNKKLFLKNDSPPLIKFCRLSNT